MWGLLAMTLYAFYLGARVTQVRQGTDKETRRKLVKARVKDRHHQIGAILLALMVLGCLEGMAVTYVNNEKLFVDAHLLVGLAMTGLIAIAAALTPFMQRGKTWARNSHIWLNVVLVLLFGWETVTGMEILQRIVDNMFAV